MMEYKGYVGKVEYDDQASLFHGEVINTKDVITFQGRSVEELQQALQASVEDYLDFCKSRGESPDKPYSGTFTLRLDPELHRQIHIYAKQENKSVNRWVTDTLESALPD